MALVLYSATLVISSFLLFLVQPMVGKMILPLLGGSPSVWNSCMVFFQMALLAGYAYTHGATAILGERRQSVLHLILLFVALLLLPIGLHTGAVPPVDGNPTGWLFWNLIVCVGPPFFIVAASAPLLQKWFALTGHPSGRDPYFLYAASNVGSLGALLAYPLLVEPNMTLGAQTKTWTIGYVVLLVAISFCAVMMRRGQAKIGFEPREISSPVFTRIAWRQRCHWLLLAAVPSSLMLGVTTHITTNVAAVPLLWVVPLAIYLLTFVLVFSRKAILPHRWMVQVLPFLVVILGPVLLAPSQELGWYVIPLHLVVFFVAAMVCHGELAQRRPDARHLTEFYLWMSVGGVVGGIFNAILAPSFFNAIIEYPIALVAAVMLMPQGGADVPRKADQWLDFIMPVGVAIIACALVTGMKIFGASVTWLSVMVVFFLPALLCFQFKQRPVRFALALGAVLLIAGQYSQSTNGDVLCVERNFFGVKRVMNSPNHALRCLAHGTTNHGCQFVDSTRAGEPLAYYHRNGPLGDLFASVIRDELKKEIAVIGLGVGAISAYIEPGDHLTYYEIDPVVEQIARDKAYFSYLSDCKGGVNVVLGDGRLALARAPDNQYGLIVLDAFSSDSIPTHLISLEATKLYLSKLRDEGVLAFHISNGFLNLEPVVAKLAEKLQLACVSRCDRDLPHNELAEEQSPSHYVVMARNSETLRPLLDRLHWNLCFAPRQVAVWTDQYCDIIGVMCLPKASTEPTVIANNPPLKPRTQKPLVLQGGPTDKALVK